MENRTMDVNEAILFLENYKEESGKTWILIASELGISSGGLSSFKSGTYSAPHTILSKVEALASVREKRSVAPREPGYKHTSISRVVTNAISYSHLQGKIAVVYGDAGIGKTMAFRRYLDDNTLAIGITISPTYASITGVNELIAERLGARERSNRKLTQEIIGKLKNSGRVIIVDEAQHLTPKALDHIRCISDESGVGITLIGNEEVYRKMKGSGRADFAQLFSRIGMRKQVLTQSITKEDVVSIFGDYIGEDKAMELIYSVCRTNYGIRGAVNLFVNTIAVFEMVSLESLGAMMKEMNIG